MSHPRIGKPKIVKHRSARSVVKQYLGKDFDAEMGGETADGETTTFTSADMIRGIEIEGMWGFADTRKKTIHVWVNRAKTKQARLINFFTHELFHLYGWPLPKHKDPIMAEEHAANLLGDLTELAVNISNRYI